MKPKVLCTVAGCGQVKNGQNHTGATWQHEFAPPSKRKRRAPLAPRSERMERIYEKERRPAVAEAVGDGMRPCAIASPVCLGTGTTLHEILPRGRAGGLEAALRDGPPPILACTACNTYASEHPDWARERGFLLKVSDVR